MHKKCCQKKNVSNSKKGLFCRLYLFFSPSLPFGLFYRFHLTMWSSINLWHGSGAFLYDSMPAEPRSDASPYIESSEHLNELHSLRLRLTAPSIGQCHLFADWPHNPRHYFREQLDLLEELLAFGQEYPGGVEQYIVNGRRLLDQPDQKSNIAEIEAPPHVFIVPSLERWTDRLLEMENIAQTALRQTVFVLVAGGIGERLGYSGAKVGLPVETATGESFLYRYLAWATHVGGDDVPFVIMTSTKTHHNTLQFIKKLGFSDLRNLIVLKQDSVFCFADAYGRLAVERNKLLRKPHGHGDIHSLLYRCVDKEGVPVLTRWKESGYKYIAFFQDTNGLAPETLTYQIAISEKNQLAMNFSAIPRLPRESLGALCYVRHINELCSKTVSIEYNLFEAVARTHTQEGGDYPEKVNGKEKKYSRFHASINNLVMELESYSRVLWEHRGFIPEFINPKYTDSTRRNFSKPARIESLMQDIAYFFSPKDRVGVSLFDRSTFLPVKNSLAEARKKLHDRLSPFCAATSEAGVYAFYRQRLRAIGIHLPDFPTEDVVVDHLLPLQVFPIIVLGITSNGTTLSGLRKLFPHPEAVHISKKSVLMITGNVIVNSLSLDGALKIEGPSHLSGPPLVVENLRVRTNRWSVNSVPPSFPGEISRMRGFELRKPAIGIFSLRGLAFKSYKL